MKLIQRSIHHLMFRRLIMRTKEYYHLLHDPFYTVYPMMASFDVEQRKRVMVLSPHADDETFGMGGTIARHVESGDEVHVVVASDNSDSVAQWEGPRRELVALREGEMLRAMEVLGVTRTRFLAVDPGDFTKNACPAGFTHHLIEIQPDLLYLPFWSDNHRDHKILNHWTAVTLRAIKSPPSSIRMYEVWSPLPATMLVDITGTMNRKLRAMACFETQMHAIAYDRHMRGLNAYRAMTAADRRIDYCEAFCEMSTPRYLDAIKNQLL